MSAAPGFHSASIFFLQFGVDAEWELLATSVRSPLLPDQALFARGVFDLPEAGLTLPVTARLNIAPLTLAPAPSYISLPLTADSSQLLIDTAKVTIDQSCKLYSL